MCSETAPGLGRTSGDADLTHESSAGTFRVTRLNGGRPVVSARQILDLGWRDIRQKRRNAGPAPASGFSSPSLIRVPDWIKPEDRPDPAARYYMYFSAHTSRFIRMAWAQDVEGPWTVHNMGVDVPLEELGVLSVWGEPFSIAPGVRIGADPQEERGSWGPMATSPFALVDDANQQILLYFNVFGYVWLDDNRLEGVRVLLAISPTGLDFKPGIQPASISTPYLTVFPFDGRYYGMTNGARLHVPFDPSVPTGGFESVPLEEHVWKRLRRPDLRACMFGTEPDGGDPPRIRHSNVVETEEDGRRVLWWFYSVKGYTEIEGVQQPEQIMMSRLDPYSDGSCWGATWPGEVVLRAAPGWEGGELAVKPGRRGAGGRFQRPVNELRDPNLLVDHDGSMYLAYTGCGEKGIGLARLERL